VTGIRRYFATPHPYVAWLLVSSALLAVAWRVDPYIFGLAAFAGVGLSICLVVAAALAHPRSLALAAVAAIPSMLAMALLSTFHWA
jgi:hypothetical protein